MTDQEAQALSARIASNPAIMQAIAEDAKRGQGGRMKYVLSDTQRQARGLGEGEAAVLKRFGIDLPHDYHVGVDPNTGAPVVKKANWFQRNQDWLLPVGTIGTAGALSLAAGPAAGASGGGGSFVGPTESMASGFVPGGTVTGLEAAAPAVKAGGGMAGSSLWSKITDVAGIAVPAIGSVAAGKVAANASDKAAEIQAQTAEKELALQREIFQQQRQDELQKYADLGQYRQIGGSSLAALAAGSGLPELSPVERVPLPVAPGDQTGGLTINNIPGRNPQTGAIDYNVSNPDGSKSYNPSLPPMSSLSTLAQPQRTAQTQQAQTQSSYVPMIDPKGRPVNIPQNMVQEAQTRGARMA